MMLIHFQINNSIYQQLNNLNTKIKAICNTKNTINLKSNLNTIQSQFKSLQTIMNRLNTTQIKMNTTALTNELTQLKTKFNNIFNGINAPPLDQFNNSLIQIKKNLTSINTKLNNLNKKLAGMGLDMKFLTQLGTLERKLNNISTPKSSINIKNNFNQIGTTIQQLKDKLINLVNTPLKINISNAITSFNSLKLKAKDMFNTINNPIMTGFNNAMSRIKSGLTALTNKVHNIKVAITGNEQVMANLNKIKTGLNQMGTGIRQLSMYSAMLFTPAMQQAKTDESAFAKFNTIAQKSTKELKGYVNMFKSYGNEMGVVTSQVANMGYEYLSGGGSKTKEGVSGFLSSTLAAAKVGYVEDYGEYAKTIKVISNNLKLDTAEGYKAINNAVLTLQNRGYFTADEYGKFAMSAYPQLHATGIKFNEFNALASVASLNMGDPANLMTGLKQFSVNISKLTPEVKKQAEAWGVEIDSRAFRRKGALKYFQDIKKAIEDAGQPVDGQSISKLFKNSKSIAFVNAIMQDLGKLETELKGFEDNSTLDNMLDSYMNSPIAKIEQAQETLRSSFSSLGSSLLPVFAEIMTAIAGVMEKVTAWIEQHPVLFEKLIKLGAILIGLATIGLVLKSVFMILGGAWQVVSGVAGLFMLILKKVMTMGLIPFMVAMFKWIAIIGAVVYALWFLHHNFGSVWNGIGAVFKTIAGGLLTGIELILGALELLVQALAFAMQKFDPFTQGVRAIGSLVGNDTMANFKNPFALLTQGLAEGIGGAKNAVGGLADKLQAEVQDSIVTIDGKLEFNPFANMGWKWPENAGAEAEQSIQDMLDSIGGDVDWGDLMPDLGDIGDIGTDGIDKIKDAVDEYTEAMEKLSDETKKWVEDFEDNIKMFDKVSKKVVNSSSLLKNAKDRATQMEELRIVKEQLQNKGLDKDVMAEISQMGVDKIAELKALNRMSNEDLKQWNNYTTSTRDDSMAMAQQTVTNIYITTDSNVADYKKIADNIYKELKRKGVKI